MNDFEDMRELVEYCYNGGRVVFDNCGLSEGFNDAGEWTYCTGEKAMLTVKVEYYTKCIPPKKVKKVKLLAFLDPRGELRLTNISDIGRNGWVRVPSEDKEIEIEIEE